MRGPLADDTVVLRFDHDRVHGHTSGVRIRRRLRDRDTILDGHNAAPTHIEKLRAVLSIRSARDQEIEVDIRTGDARGHRRLVGGIDDVDFGLNENVRTQTGVPGNTGHGWHNEARIRRRRTEYMNRIRYADMVALVESAIGVRDARDVIQQRIVLLAGETAIVDGIQRIHRGLFQNERSPDGKHVQNGVGVGHIQNAIAVGVTVHIGDTRIARALKSAIGRRGTIHESNGPRVFIVTQATALQGHRSNPNVRRPRDGGEGTRVRRGRSRRRRHARLQGQDRNGNLTQIAGGGDLVGRDGEMAKMDESPERDGARVERGHLETLPVAIKVGIDGDVIIRTEGWIFRPRGTRRGDPRGKGDDNLDTAKVLIVQWIRADVNVHGCRRGWVIIGCVRTRRVQGRMNANVHILRTRQQVGPQILSTRRRGGRSLRRSEFRLENAANVRLHTDGLRVIFKERQDPRIVHPDDRRFGGGELDDVLVIKPRIVGAGENVIVCELDAPRIRISARIFEVERGGPGPILYETEGGRRPRTGIQSTGEILPFRAGVGA